MIGNYIHFIQLIHICKTNSLDAKKHEALSILLGLNYVNYANAPCTIPITHWRAGGRVMAAIRSLVFWLLNVANFAVYDQVLFRFTNGKLSLLAGAEP